MAQDVTKLPKWAQQRIETLERNLAHAHAKLAEGPKDSRVFSNPYAESPTPLGRDPHILFKVGPDFGEEIHVTIDGKGIKVMGGSRIAIFPQDANVMQIRSFR